MPCSITDGPQDDCDFMPELTEVEEQLVLEMIDHDWRGKFHSARIAWNHYYEFEAPLMDRIALDLYRERQAAECRKEILARKITDGLIDELAGIAMPPKLARLI